MESFKIFDGLAVALETTNVDTDQIIPKQFLKLLGKTGFGKFLFYDWRFLTGDQPNPNFILNQPQYQGAKVLIAGDNFGCGSSREHAPWALLDYGFQVIISSSFADIFFNNCYKNGILPIVVSKDVLQKLFALFKTEKNLQIHVDLPQQFFTANQGEKIPFQIEALRKEFLLKGLDDIAWTLQWEKDIHQFEQNQKKSLPWLWERA